MKQAIESLLYAALLGAKRQAALFSEEEEIRLIRLCQNYLIAGFMYEVHFLRILRVGLAFANISTKLLYFGANIP